MLETGGIGSIECDMGIESSVNISEGDNVGILFRFGTIRGSRGEKGVSFAVWAERMVRMICGGMMRKSEDGAYHYDWTVKKHKSLRKIYYFMHMCVQKARYIEELEHMSLM